MKNTSLLSSSSIFGLATVLVYAPIDWLFSRKAHFIFYLDSDFLANTTTPIAIILNWVVFATLAAYCYQRLAAICQTRFASDAENPSGGSIGGAMLAAGVTGIGAAAGSIVIYALGAIHLWEWNALQVDRMPQIASVPIFIPIAFLLTFLLCPSFFGVANSFLREQHPGVAGIRCGIIIGGTPISRFSAVLRIEIEMPIPI